MAKGREKSDGRVVPEGRRKAVPIAEAGRGGKATTANKWAGQLELFRETANSPKGDVDGADVGLPASATIAVPKSRDTTGTSLPAMTEPQARQCPGADGFCAGIVEGGNTGAELPGLVPGTSASRRAGCEAHKSGSVGAGAAQAALATRQGRTRLPVTPWQHPLLALRG